MIDPFLSNEPYSNEQLITLLRSYEFPQEIYHPDGYGHLQVEIPVNINACSFSWLIEQIESHQLWEEAKALLATQPQTWLIEFSRQLQMLQSDGVINCLVEMTSSFKSPETRINHLIGSSDWYWQPSTIAQIDTVIKQLTQFRFDEHQNSAAMNQFDRQIIDQTLDALRCIRLAAAN